MPLLEKLGDGLWRRRLVVLIVLHLAANLLWTTGAGQAAPIGLGGPRISSAAGVALGSGSAREPFRATGASFSVEAAWMFAGGSAHHFELGLRGERFVLDDLRIGHEASILGGARVAIVKKPWFWGITPSLGGGLRAGVARDQGGRGHLSFGPHLSLSFERALTSASTLALDTTAHATLTDPLRITLAFGLTLFAPTLP